MRCLCEVKVDVRPRLLDLFCGAGGAAVGYYRAGFDVVDVDIKPQPHYPFEFIQADAMTFPLAGFDAIHASPPCQFATVANNIHQRTDHPDYLTPTLAMLRMLDLPWVVENVEARKVWRIMRNPYRLCGLTFGLNVKRHRLFESSQSLLVPPCPPGHPGDWLLVFGHTVLNRGHQIGRTAKGGPIIRRQHQGTDKGRAAMGIDWMNRDELSEAIPPAYTEYIGRQLMAVLRG